MGAAERIFVCPETATRILDHLSPGPKLEQHDEEWTPAYVKMEVERERRVRQRALARVAQVCRAISERALDRLWEFVDDPRWLQQVTPGVFQYLVGPRQSFLVRSPRPLLHVVSLRGLSDGRSCSYRQGT